MCLKNDIYFNIIVKDENEFFLKEYFFLKILKMTIIFVYEIPYLGEFTITNTIIG
jgi:hypothetical protein